MSTTSPGERLLKSTLPLSTRRCRPDSNGPRWSPATNAAGRRTPRNTLVVGLGAIDVPLTETRAAFLRQLTGDALDDQDIGDGIARRHAAPDMHQVVP